MGSVVVGVVVHDGDVRDGDVVVLDVGVVVRDGDVRDVSVVVHDDVVVVRAIFFLGTASLLSFRFRFNPSNSAFMSLSKSSSSKCSSQRRK